MEANNPAVAYGHMCEVLYCLRHRIYYSTSYEVHNQGYWTRAPIQYKDDILLV